LKRVTRLPTSVTTPARSLRERGRKLEMHDGFEHPRRDHVVDRVQASGVDLNQQFVGLQPRARDVGEPYLGRLA
jgi:hypothetical protein